MLPSDSLLPTAVPVTGPAASLVVDARQAPSALLARLIQEVQQEGQPALTAYNRTHNRHNRGR